VYRDLLMKIFVTGGTGFVGAALTKRLVEQGHEVTTLTRSTQAVRSMSRGVALLGGDPQKQGVWQHEVARHEVIINLAGESIFRRWTATTKKQIRDSRILTTQHLVESLSTRRGKDTLLLNASAVGYYGFREDEELDENGSPGNDFLAMLAQDWEARARKAEGQGVRVVLCRFGIVLGRDGGAMKQMLPGFKLGLGSPLGDGRQWFSWIHEIDLVNGIVFLIGRKDISGAVNCTAPHPVRNQELTKILGEVLHRPTFMPSVPRWVLRLAVGEFGTVLLHGQKVLPQKLLDNGFTFQFPTLMQALHDLVTQ
jgi:uncharacterized protein (TIGR01777 family)